MQGRMTFRPYGARIHFGIPNPPAYAGGYRQAAPYGAHVFGFAKNGDAGCGFVSSSTKRGLYLFFYHKPQQISILLCYNPR